MSDSKTTNADQLKSAIASRMRIDIDAIENQKSAFGALPPLLNNALAFYETTSDSAEANYLTEDSDTHDLLWQNLERLCYIASKAKSSSKEDLLFKIKLWRFCAPEHSRDDITADESLLLSIMEDFSTLPST